jgi:hypothetical protein
MAEISVPHPRSADAVDVRGREEWPIRSTAYITDEPRAEVMEAKVTA